MSRNIVGVLGTAIIAIYIFGSGRLVTTDQQWYRLLSKPAWQPPSYVVGLIWPYNFALLIAATGRCQPPLEHPPTGLVDFSRTECGGSSRVGLVVF